MKANLSKHLKLPQLHLDARRFSPRKPTANRPHLKARPRANNTRRTKFLPPATANPTPAKNLPLVPHTPETRR